MRLRVRGFTLVEMMVVVAIGAVLSSIAVVTLRDTLNAKREVGAARSVAQLVKRARLIAVDTHSIVEVQATVATSTVTLLACKSAYGANACAGALTMTPVPQGELVLNQGDLRGVKLTTVPATSLTFSAAGFPTVPGTYTYVVDQNEKAGTQSVVVTASGEIRVQ